MSEEQLKSFIEKATTDASLMEKLKAAGDADAMITVAKDAGFTISVDDINNSIKSFDGADLSEQELEAVAGGTLCGVHLLMILAVEGTVARNAPPPAAPWRQRSRRCR